MGSYVNRTGRRYGELTVLSDAGRNSLGQAIWLCKCDCGNEKVVSGGHLHSGDTMTCGCKKGGYKHGENTVNGRTPEYRALANIIQRCTNPNHNAYSYYGGRGITVYWKLEDYLDFLAHIGRRPSKTHSVDRWPNLNGNYEPGNVRWATKGEQSRNTRRNVILDVNGEKLCLKDASDKFGISWYTVRGRLKKGWTVMDALTTKPL